jgi:hypothetical protein
MWSLAMWSRAMCSNAPLLPSAPRSHEPMSRVRPDARGRGLEILGMATTFAETRSDDRQECRVRIGDVRCAPRTLRDRDRIV